MYKPLSETITFTNSIKTALKGTVGGGGVLGKKFPILPILTSPGWTNNKTDRVTRETEILLCVHGDLLEGGPKKWARAGSFYTFLDKETFVRN